MKDDEVQKAIIYCRVSSRKLKLEGHGADSQETTCREYADRKGYEVERPADLKVDQPGIHTTCATIAAAQVMASPSSEKLSRANLKSCCMT